MIEYTLTRRIFLVPLAPNNHGKSTLLRAFLSQAQQREWQRPPRSARELWTPWGRAVDGFVCVRSYQETLATEHGSVQAALDAEDQQWHTRDLVVMPSHLKASDCEAMIKAAHSAGFDAICVPVIIELPSIGSYSACVALPWDERWTLSNPTNANPGGQLDALGRDLWTRTAAALTGQ